MQHKKGTSLAVRIGSLILAGLMVLGMAYTGIYYLFFA